MVLERGTILGNYVVQEALAAGGMASVYVAEDRRSGARVAIKVLDERLALDAAQVERFRREAHIASLLRSPYTVRLLEFGQEGGRYYIAQEFVDGRPLSQVLRSGPLDAATAISIATQVALSLEEAADRGIVHRDIKPANILVSGDDTVRLADFGIASLIYDAGPTIPGTFIGTAAYAAPEQHDGRPGIEADIYSLGCVLFEMLAGSRPFPGTSVTALMREHEEAPPPLDRLAAIPRVLANVVARCLEKDPAARYQRPSDLVEALGEARDALAGGDAAATIAIPAGVEETSAAAQGGNDPGGRLPPTAAVPRGQGWQPPFGERRDWAIAGAAAAVAVFLFAAFLVLRAGDEGVIAGEGNPGGTNQAIDTEGAADTSPVGSESETPTPSATPTSAPVVPTDTSPPPPPTPTPGPVYRHLGFGQELGQGNLPAGSPVAPGSSLGPCNPPNIFTWVEYENVRPPAQVQGRWFLGGAGAGDNPISNIDDAGGTLWFQYQDPDPGTYTFEMSVIGGDVVVSGSISVC